MANKRIDEKGRDRSRDAAAREDRAGQPFDLLRIDCIRAALAEGDYVVNPRRIAEKLLQFERSLPP
jgi:flagellar biosynthesis anti-sigma factor FlgM